VRAKGLILLWFLAGCTTLETGRDEANAAAGTAKPHPSVAVSVQGGAITELVPATGGRPPRVHVRAQSLDLRLELRDTGCAPSAVTFEVSHLPAGVQASWRPLLDAVLPEVAASREASGGAVDFLADPDDRDRTPLAAERTFDPQVEGTVRVWTVRTDRGAGRAELLPGVAPALTGEAGACTTLEAAGATGLGAAALVVRHRLQRPIKNPFRFAVFGNNAGDGDRRRQITAAITAAASDTLPDRERVLFVVINGDLTEEGTASELRAVSAALDAELPMPWYATVGERDLISGATTSVVQALGQTTYAIDAGATRLMIMDSGDAAFTLKTFDLLDTWLGDTPLAWPTAPVPPARLLITHTPPFDPYGTRGGGFKSRQDAARLVATLRRAQVPLVLTAQLARFQRQDVAGVEVIHAGGGGAPMEAGAHHWLTVDVGADCRPPGAPGEPEGANCGERCGGGLWCDDGTCRPCVVVTRRDIE
jgi:hypothetical protein